MTIHLPIAASTETLCRVGDHQPARGRGVRGSAIPCWANTAQGRALLTAIMAERPRIEVYDDGLSAWNGRRYVGRNAAQLRTLFDRTYAMMLHWVDAARVRVEPGMPQPALYDQRREAVVAWAKEFGPDHVIARVLGEAL